MMAAFNRRVQVTILVIISLAAAGLLTLTSARAYTPMLVLLAAALAHVVVLLPVIRRLNQSPPGTRPLTDRLLAVGIGLLAVSLAARGWAWRPAGIDPEPMIPSASEMFSLAGLLAISGALLWLSLRRTRRFGRIRALLDYLILLIAVLSLTWLILLDPPISLGMADLPRVLWLGIGPMLDLALLAIVFRLQLTGALDETRFHALGLFTWLLLRLTADLLYGLGYLQEQMIRPSASAIGWLLSALALWGAIRAADSAAQPESQPLSRRPSLALRLGRGLPVIAAYLVVGFAALDRWASGTFGGFAVSSSIFLLLLLLARQGVISGQAELMQYASLVNSAADLAFVIDQTGGFILVNPAFQRATGAQPGTGTRASLGDVVVDNPQVGDALEQAFHHGWSGELPFLSPDGVPFPVHLSLAPVYDERRGELVLSGTGHDLTETNQREQQLREALTAVDHARTELEELNIGLERKVSERTRELEQLVQHLETLNEELQELDQLKSDFVTLVSHELRSPLTNIRSGLELTLRRERRALSESGMESLDLVLQETDRLSSFVETILDLSALEAGRLPMRIHPVDPRIMIAMVRNRFPSDQAGRIEFAPPDPAPLILADEPSLASVLFHILDNAIKYAGGEIEVRVEDQEDRVVISVLDDGPGIPEQHQEAIFDRFHRLDSSDSREVYGHGLGLYLCRRLTEAMGGKVVLSMDHSPGARFDVDLPGAKRAGPPVRETDQDRRARARESTDG